MDFEVKKLRAKFMPHIDGVKVFDMLICGIGAD